MLAEKIRTPAEFRGMSREEKLAYLNGVGQQFLGNGHPRISYGVEMPEPYRSILDLTAEARSDGDESVRRADV